MTTYVLQKIQLRIHSYSNLQLFTSVVYIYLILYHYIVVIESFESISIKL